MDIEPQARRIVGAVVALAHSMGAEAVAEGLEDDAQVGTLLELGCELGQGHAFAAAAPAGELEALLLRSRRGGGERVRVYLCDDAPALRMLLHTFLEFGGDVDVVGEAADGEGLTEAVLASGADVVLLDLSMPRVDGLEALADLRAAAPELGIVVLSGFEEERMGAKALALGADRYVEKAVGMEEVRSAVRAVAAARRDARPGGCGMRRRARDKAARERHALELHDNVVQNLTAIHWALEAGAYEQARELTAAALQQAQGMIGDLLDEDGDETFAPGALRRESRRYRP